MSKLITASIDVNKIDKSKLFKGKKGTYLSIDIWISDEEDKFGNHAAINQSQSKEEREAKVKKNYIGNGKKQFGWDDAPTSKPVETSEEVPF